MGNTQEKMHEMIKKTKALWSDKRSYKQRLLIALAPIFAACYTFLFFGPVEITAFAHDSISFTFMEVLPFMLGTAVVVCIVVTLLTALLRGRIFNFTVTGIFAVVICGYLQGNFWNGHMGALTGDAIKWERYRVSMELNLLLWFAVTIGVYLVLYFNKVIWRKGMLYISAALFLMQTVALVTICMGADSYQSGIKAKNFLTTKEMYSYSKGDNTLVFLLDRMDYDYIASILAESPEFFDKLDGFTSYTNAIAETARTKPAANYMLTNCDKYMFHVPADEYFEQSWMSKKNVLKELSEKGYTVDVYTDISDMFGSGTTMEPYISNMSNERSKLNAKVVGNKLRNLSAYRYVPNALKPYFWTYTDAVNEEAYLPSNSEQFMYEINDVKYGEGIGESVLTDQKYFKFYHLNGSHSPYILKADGTRSAEATNPVEQTKGCFNILYNVFSEMKQLGIYEDASIIITADHGDPVTDSEPLKKATRIGLFYKPPGEADKPLKSSNAPVSFKNIPATIARDSGLKYTKYGTALDEVKENSEVTRIFYKTVMRDNVEKDLYEYEIKGDAADLNNWVLRDQRPLLDYWFYKY